MPEHQGFSPRPVLIAASALSTRLSWRSIQACERWPSPRPQVVRAARMAGVDHAVGQRLPGAHLGAAAPDSGIRRFSGERVSRYSTITRESNTRLAAFQHQAGTLPSGLALRMVSAFPDIFEFELVVELLLGQHDAHLAHVGAGRELR